jgi:hypothetical protein
MMQVKRISSILFAALLALTFILSGCGASKDESATAMPEPTTPVAPVVNSYVRYEGTTLVVFGKFYYPVAQDPRLRFAGEQLIVGVITGKETEFSSLLEQLSLEVIQPLWTGSGAFLVKVPSGFEEQWARALSDQASVQYAAVNEIMTTQ